MLKDLRCLCQGKLLQGDEDMKHMNEVLLNINEVLL